MNPPAFLALWNGVRPGHAAEYEAWHALEHAPERLGAPGFRAFGRYREEEGGDYFTLYELDGLEALLTPAYAELMREPTAWSARMRPLLTGFRRLPCASLMDGRSGVAGALATIRIAGEGEAVLPRLRPCLDAATADGCLHGAVLGAAREAGQAYAVFPDAPVPGVEALLLLFSSETEALTPVVDRCVAALPDLACSVGRWRLLQRLVRNELRDPSAPRQPPRDDLRFAWESEGRTVQTGRPVQTGRSGTGTSPSARPAPA